MQWNDSVRAAFMALVQAAFPLLQLAGVIDFTSDQVAVCMLFIQNIVTFGMLVFKKGQAPGDPIVVAQGSETAAKKSDLN